MHTSCAFKDISLLCINYGLLQTSWYKFQHDLAIVTYWSAGIHRYCILLASIRTCVSLEINWCQFQFWKQWTKHKHWLMSRGFQSASGLMKFPANPTSLYKTLILHGHGFLLLYHRFESMMFYCAQIHKLCCHRGGKTKIRLGSC